MCFAIGLSSTGKFPELNAAISVNLSTPEYGSCGQVRINGGVAPSSGTITRLSWDWGDGTVIDSFFEAAHTYSRNGAYEIKVTAYSSTGETQIAGSSVMISRWIRKELAGWCTHAVFWHVRDWKGVG